MEGRPNQQNNLYPDLQEFYSEGLVETGSSIDLPIYRCPSLSPTAPPEYLMHEEFEQDMGAPEEPELDYTMELEPDYDMDDLNVDTLNNLNLNAREKKILLDKNIEVPQTPRDTRDFRAWMNWRMQANKLLAAVILIRKGHQVQIRQSEIRRKPLTKQNVQTIVQEARGDFRHLPRDKAERTSLSGCPYIMYGIPRVKLAATGKR